MAARSVIKVALLEAYFCVHEMDITCLSERFLDSSVPSYNNNLQNPGNRSARADHETRKSSYVLQKFLRTKLIDVEYLHESLNFELRFGEKICKFLSLYRLPGQNKDDFEMFSENLK